MDLYNVIIIIPSTGNRIVLDGVSAEVEIQNNMFKVEAPQGQVHHIAHKPTHLDIVIELANPDYDQFRKVKTELYNEELLLNFVDTHPNLVKCRLMNITWDQKKITFELRGNTIDKTYIDYIAEVTDQLNAYQYHLKPLDIPKMESLTKPKKKVISVPKRKLTF